MIDKLIEAHTVIAETYAVKAFLLQRLKRIPLNSNNKCKYNTRVRAYTFVQ
jgi:hypothetical protein